MANRISTLKQKTFPKIILLTAFVAFGAMLPAASAKDVFISQWGRFEQTFKSNTRYPNALQDVTLSVIFTSPGGETNLVHGFWDGEKTWRVRFSPNELGRWTFKTVCSDPANKGLNNQSGQFLCTAVTGKNRFANHGPVRVASDRRHFEHADGTPFFWLADTTSSGARVSSRKDWEVYSQIRASQKFSAVQWVAASGVDSKKQTAFTGADRIVVSPEFFQRLDSKIETLNRAGLLSVIVPLSETNTEWAALLPEDQVVLLLRYMRARWGAGNVAWLISFEGAATNTAARWKRICRAVFGATQHAPVIVFPGSSRLTFDEFRDEKWADAFGCGLGESAVDDPINSLLSGSFAEESRKQPAHPLINILSISENRTDAKTGRRVTADEIRRLVWWSLLTIPHAGISYSAEGVVDWDTSVVASTGNANRLPNWELAAFMPGAKQMSHVTDIFGSLDFWLFQRDPQIVARQPGLNSRNRFIAAAMTDAKERELVYVPEDRTVELLLGALPPALAIGWVNPRTGENNPAVAIVGERTCQFPTPAPGDWLLLMRSGNNAPQK